MYVARTPQSMHEEMSELERLSLWPSSVGTLGRPYLLFEPNGGDLNLYYLANKLLQFENQVQMELL